MRAKGMTEQLPSGTCGRGSASRSWVSTRWCKPPPFCLGGALRCVGVRMPQGILILLGCRVGCQRAIRQVVYSDSGNLLLSASMDETVAVWNARSYELIDFFKYETCHACFCVAISPREQLIAEGRSAAGCKLSPLCVRLRRRTPRWAGACSFDGSVRLWSIAEGSRLDRKLQSIREAEEKQELAKFRQRAGQVRVPRAVLEERGKGDGEKPSERRDHPFPAPRAAAMHCRRHFGMPNAGPGKPSLPTLVPPPRPGKLAHRTIGRPPPWANWCLTWCWRCEGGAPGGGG